MRGKRFHDLRVQVLFRIIPAHAGQTRSSPFLSLSFADHPRACGANGTVNGVNQRQHGSSPRMRGKQGGGILMQIPSRIIPAHAGQTRSPSCHCRVHSDHPRACGANAAIFCTVDGICGSSPRMRGKPLGYDTADKLHRIIPAHAGQTPAW